VNVEAMDVIEAYKAMLSEANHEIAILKAQIATIQGRQEDIGGRESTGRNGIGGSPTSG
jgi:hypothetical protein